MKTKTIRLSNELSQLEFLATELEILGEEWEIGMGDVLNLNLVLEELVTNIIFYGYPDKTEQQIEISLWLEEGLLGMRITDEAIAFNPLEAKAPDLDQAIEDRPIGGLGIHLVKKIMDDVRYERVDNRNILTLQKQLK